MPSEVRCIRVHRTSRQAPHGAVAQHYFDYAGDLFNLLGARLVVLDVAKIRSNTSIVLSPLDTLGLFRQNQFERITADGLLLKMQWSYTG